MASAPLKDGVVAVIQDSLGRHLFIQRGWALKRAPGVWCFVGGEVEPGEALEAALVREVREEVGLDVAPIQKVHESVSPTGEFRLHWFTARMIDPAQAIRPDAYEVAEARWLTIAEALQLEPILPTLKMWLSSR